MLDIATEPWGIKVARAVMSLRIKVARALMSLRIKVSEIDNLPQNFYLSILKCFLTKFETFH